MGDYEYLEEMESRHLVIVDVQYDFCEGGALAVQGGNEVARLISEYVASNWRDMPSIVTTQDWHVDPGDHWSENPDFVDSWPVHCKAGERGAELHPAIQSLAPVVNAAFFKGMYTASYSGAEAPFFETAFPRVLAGSDMIGQYVDVCGLATDYCVWETAKDLAERGYSVRILEDLSAHISDERLEGLRQEAVGLGIKFVEVLG